MNKNFNNEFQDEETPFMKKGQSAKTYMVQSSIRNLTSDKTHQDFLNNITTQVDLREEGKGYSILFAKSNKYQSAMVLEVKDDALIELYKSNYVIRCYRNREKVFEMPLKQKPLFFDILRSTVAYILEGENNKFSAIDIGIVSNSQRDIDEDKDHMATPRELKHDFEEKIIGFKLGYYQRVDQGLMKAVFWSEQKMYMHAFNVRLSDDEESSDRFIMNFRQEIEFSGSISVQRIYDFGVDQNYMDEYDENKPEMILLTDENKTIHVIKGSNYRDFDEEYIKYPDEEVDGEDYRNECDSLKEIYDLKLAETYKVIGLIQKELKDDDEVQKQLGPETYVQVFEFNKNEKEKSLKMTRFFPVRVNQQDIVTEFNQNYVEDSFNGQIYFKDFSNAKKDADLMVMIPIKNNFQNKADIIQMDAQIAMNITACNLNLQDKNAKKTRGLIYTDFLTMNNLLIIVHGRFVSIIDVVNKENEVKHVMHPDIGKKEEDNYYDFEYEPTQIWLQDKIVKDSKSRWRIIVAFKNKDVLELITHQSKYTDYLKDGLHKPIKLPEDIEIVKILRNQNCVIQPTYFIVKQNGKNVLGTIEFYNQDFRTYYIPEANETSIYIILNKGDEQQLWQEVVCINTEEKGESIEQKLIHFKIRIGQGRLQNHNEEITEINNEVLSQDMSNVIYASNIFVCDNLIYFVYKSNKEKEIKAHIEQYNLTDNSVVLSQTSETLSKIKVFDNQYYYWRTNLGGLSENMFQSNVFFDGIQDFNEFNKSINEDIQVASGIYPHINKLFYDTVSDSIACFYNFYQIKIFPLLHISKIKVKVEGNKEEDDHIIATKVFEPGYLISAHQSGIIKAWNINTGKYLCQKSFADKKQYQDFIWHQRINDELTLIKEERPIYEEENLDDRNFAQKYDFTDIQNNTHMFRYRIIQIVCQGNINENNILASIFVNIEKSFIGPSLLDTTEFGLYCGDELNQLIFFIKDSQEKFQINYFAFKEDTKFNEDDQKYENEDFIYLKKENYKQEQQDARLSVHSPNFKQIIRSEGSGSKIYSIRGHDMRDFIIPVNLCNYSSQSPNFITNDCLLFTTNDKIIKCFQFNTTNPDMIKRKDDKEYVNGKGKYSVAHCKFPGATDEINLATLLMVSSSKNNYNLIGENCLTYHWTEKEGTENTNFETIVPNCYNSFFLNAANEYEGSPEYNEMKIIQCHYKSKFEFVQNAIFGYVFQQKESSITQLQINSSLSVISTFSYYQWRILNLIAEKKLNPQTLSPLTIKDLSYCQLATGKTLLHELCENQNQLEYIFQTVQQDLEDGNPFYIPLLKDNEENTALHQALKKLNNSSLIKKQRTRVQIEPEASEQNQDAGEEGDPIQRGTAELILKHIGIYPFDLFKVDIKMLIDIIIKNSLTEFGQYMDNRAVTPSFLEDFDRSKIVVEESLGAKYFVENEIWTSETEVFKNKFEDKVNGENKLIQLKIIDIPYVHYFTSNKDNAIYAELAKSTDDSIFSIQSIKAVIEQKWPLVYFNVFWKLLIPYLVFLIIFTYYTVNDLETSFADQQKDTLETLATHSQQDTFVLAVLCRVFIFLFTTYFFIIEIIQTNNQGIWEHIQDFWNWLDIVPPFLIYTAELMNICNGDYKLIRTLYSLTAIAMWLRFLYFFRIFKATNFFIRMIIEVLKDMQQFFFVLFIGILAFGHTYYIFFMNHNSITTKVTINELGEQVISMESSQNEIQSFIYSLLYAYQMALGQFAWDNFNVYMPLLAWLYWFFATLILIIVLLNLLISIVGSTFGNVYDNKDVIMYKDMVDLIVENQFLTNEKQMAEFNDGKYLVIAVPQDNVANPEEQIEKNFSDLKEVMKGIKEENISRQAKIEYGQNRIITLLKQQQKEIEEIKKKVSTI